MSKITRCLFALALVAFGALGSSVFFPSAESSLTADQIYKLNKAGPLFREIQLGTYLDGLESGAQLDTGSVTSAKILDGTIVVDDIATDGVGAAEIAADAVGTSEIATDGVGSAEIAADAVASSEIAADAVGTSEIATDGVAAAEIAEGAVGTSELADGTVAEADVVAPTGSVRNLDRVARAVYDFATDGGAQGTISLGVSLPANAIITRSYIYTVTQFVDAGAGTHAFQCEDANNILTAGDLTGVAAGTITEGESTGSAATMKAGISAQCNISIVIGGADLTAGKAVVYVHYVVAE